MRRLQTATTIRIEDKVLDIAVVKVVYRCAVCFGNLDYRNSGLACKADRTHTGFIHRDKAEQLKAEQAANLQEVSQFYEIKDGIVVIKERTS